MNVEQKIGILLKKYGYTLSAAESCTGGRISHLLTTVSGSSAYYLGSVTSYAVSVKVNVLKVPADVIATAGVVSSEVAAAMAQGVRKLTGSTFAVASTGLAEGGDEHYPEGTVWIGVCGPAGTSTLLYQYNNGRKANIKRFTTVALHFLLKNIESYINTNKPTGKTF